MNEASRPARALWIEIHLRRSPVQFHTSRPARALWIEILEGIGDLSVLDVEAREGLVD